MTFGVGRPGLFAWVEIECREPNVFRHTHPRRSVNRRFRGTTKLGLSVAAGERKTLINRPDGCNISFGGA